MRHSSEQAGDPQKNRSYLITRRDLHNIAQRLNISARDTSDYEVQSLEAYPEDIRSSDPETDTEPDPNDIPPIIAAATRPECSADEQRSIVLKLGDLLTRAEAFEGHCPRKRVRR